MGKSDQVLIEQESVITFPSKRQSLPSTMLCCSAMIDSSKEVYTRSPFCCEELTSPTVAQDAQGFTSKPCLYSSVGLRDPTPRHAVRWPQCRKIQKINGGARVSPAPLSDDCVINRNRSARHVRLRLSHKMQKCMLTTVKIADNWATSVFMRAPGPVRATCVPPSETNRRAA